MAFEMYAKLKDVQEIQKILDEGEGLLNLDVGSEKGYVAIFLDALPDSNDTGRFKIRSVFDVNLEATNAWAKSGSYAPAIGFTELLVQEDNVTVFHTRKVIPL